MEHILKDQKQTRRTAPNLTGVPVQRKMPPGHGGGVRLQYTPEEAAEPTLETVFLHRNSPQPAVYGANAMIQGRHIFVSPGQSASIPHELAHLRLGHPWIAQPGYTENGVGVCSRPDWESQADRLAGTLETSGFSFIEMCGGAPASNGEPLLLDKTAHEKMLDRYQNKTGGKPSKALQRKNFSDYQRMLYWLDYTIASMGNESSIEHKKTEDADIAKIKSAEIPSFSFEQLNFLFSNYPSKFLSLTREWLEAGAAGGSTKDLANFVNLVLVRPEYHTTAFIFQFILEQKEGDSLREIFTPILDKYMEAQLRSGNEETQRCGQMAYILEFLTHLVKSSNNTLELFQHIRNCQPLFQAIQENDPRNTLKNMMYDFELILKRLSLGFPEWLEDTEHRLGRDVCVNILKLANFYYKGKLTEKNDVIFAAIKQSFETAIALLPQSVQHFPDFWDNFVEGQDLQFLNAPVMKTLIVSNPDILYADQLWSEFGAEAFGHCLSAESKLYAKNVLMAILNYLAAQIPEDTDGHEEGSLGMFFDISKNPEDNQWMFDLLYQLCLEGSETYRECREAVRTSIVKTAVLKTPNIQENVKVVVEFYNQKGENLFEKRCIVQFMRGEVEKTDTVPELLSLLLRDDSLLARLLKKANGLTKTKLSMDIWALFSGFLQMDLVQPSSLEETIWLFLGIYENGMAAGKETDAAEETYGEHDGEHDGILGWNEYSAALFQHLKNIIVSAIEQIGIQEVAILNSADCARLLEAFSIEKDNDCINAVLAQVISDNRDLTDHFFPQAFDLVKQDADTHRSLLNDLTRQLSSNKAFSLYLKENGVPLNQTWGEEYRQLYLNILTGIRAKMISWPQEEAMPLTFCQVMRTLRETGKDLSGSEQAVFRFILNNYESFFKRPNKEHRLSLSSIHPRHIIPYSDIKGIVSVFFSKNPFIEGTPEHDRYADYRTTAGNAIVALINYFSAKNSELEGSGTQSGYDLKIGRLWQETYEEAHMGLQSPRVRKQVEEFIPLLANHPCNIFMGDAPQNVMLGNRFDAGEEGVAMYQENYINELLTWWFGILRDLGLTPVWNSKNRVYESAVSRDIEGNPAQLDQRYLSIP